MPRVPSALALFIATLLFAAASEVSAKVNLTIIRSLGAEEFMTVAPEDAAQLRSVYGSQPDLIPRLVPRPQTPLGPAFQVFDDYWDTLARHHQLPETDGDVTIHYFAVYYPHIRVARLASADEEFWFELDSGRDAFLQRYIVLLEQGIMEPTFLDVLRVTRDVRGEDVDVKFRLDGPLVTLSEDVANRFWPALLSAPPRPAPPSHRATSVARTPRTSASPIPRRGQFTTIRTSVSGSRCRRATPFSTPSSARKTSSFAPGKVGPLGPPSTLPRSCSPSSIPSSAPPLSTTAPAPLRPQH